MDHTRTLRAAAAPALILAAAGAASAAIVDHTFVLTLEHSLTGAKMSIPPAIKGIEVANAAALGGPGTNPLYNDDAVVIDNPFYDDDAEPGTPGSVISIALSLFQITAAGKDGIIHRDLATRNHLILTAEGAYTPEPGTGGTWGNDGGDIIGGIGPVRWMAPESIHHSVFTGGLRTDGYWFIAAGSHIDVAYPVPAPTAASVLALGCALVAPRRR